MALKAGDAAPDVSLYHHPKELVQLSDYWQKGPLVLLFFPLAFSGVCTNEIHTVSEDHAAYEALGAQVLALSIDSPYTNHAFAESCDAAFPILSDFHRDAARAYDVLREEVSGLRKVSERAAFIIDTTGTIRYAWVGENPGVFPPLDEIKQALTTIA